MKIKLALLGIMTLGTFSISANKAASDKQANEATEYRQAIFKLVKSNVGPLGGMARNKVEFDIDVVKKNSARLNQLSAMIPDYFVTNTSEFDVSTEALPKIWENQDDFNSKANEFNVATAAIMSSVESGDEASIKKAIGGMFRTCKACHDEYKKD